MKESNDNASVVEISEEEVMSLVNRNNGQLSVAETPPSFRETIACRVLIWAATGGAILAVITLLIFAILVVRDPQNAPTHVDMCLKMFQGVTSTLCLPYIIVSALSFFFGQQVGQPKKTTGE